MITFRKAAHEDVPAIVSLLANDELGKLREKNTNPLPDSYYQAFEKIAADPNQELMVILSDKIVIGTFQLTWIPYMNYGGSSRLLVESVRISDAYRGKGIGKEMMEWVIQRAKDREVHMVQLTSDKKRPDAIRFYERLGFVASHEGLKLHLKKNS